MLFDLEDYFQGGAIGNYNRPPNTVFFGDKEDAFGTSRETFNAFLKAVNQWFLASTAWHPPYTCTPNPDSYYYGEFQDALVNWYIKKLILVNSYIGCPGVNLTPPCTGNFPAQGVYSVTLTKSVPQLIPMTGNTWLYEPVKYDFNQDIDFGNYENLTEEVLNDYITASQELMCTLKKLIKITVGSDIEDVVNVPDFIFTPTL